jgi:fumarate reductase flavoprotein subunit
VSGSIPECDVVLVGAGLAGGAAALSAAEVGARVSSLEKQPGPGGNSLPSGGGLAFAGADRQRADGIEDGSQRSRADLQRTAGDFGDPRLIDTYVCDQLETYYWLKGYGFHFGSLQVGSANTVPRVHRAVPPQLFVALLAACATNDQVVSTEASVRRLLLDETAGGMQGFEVEEGGSLHAVTARRTVPSTGGFSRSPDLIARFATSMLAAVPIGSDGSSDGLRMAWAIGAGLRDLGFIRATFGSYPAATGASNTSLLAVYKGAVMVNRGGRRFANESLGYEDLGGAYLTQPGQIAYQVFDSAVMAHSNPEASPCNFEQAHQRGVILKATSPEALADFIGIDAGVLTETVSTYNQRRRRPSAKRTSDPTRRWCASQVSSVSERTSLGRCRARDVVGGLTAAKTLSRRTHLDRP